MTRGDMMHDAEELIYVPHAELRRLQANAGRTHSLGWWLSGFACGFAVAIITGWAT